MDDVSGFFDKKATDFNLCLELFPFPLNFFNELKQKLAVINQLSSTKHEVTTIFHDKFLCHIRFMFSN